MRIAPWVHVVPEQGAVPVDLLLPMTGRTYVVRLDGREMGDTDAVFMQFYDGLRLPDYFGWNWNALFDCLRDLHWLPAEHYVLIIEAADEILPGDPAGQRLLFETLVRAGRRWSRTRRSDGVDLSRLVIVMSCAAASVANLREQLRTCWDDEEEGEGDG
ncbi:barstar family protein [Streptomyces sp. NRRL S-237]|uniref:barstar family protein n=1 Tax=Streptomyces sp. NRRL S-237 TaxID=1463895 RepID=UPI00056AF2B5|nr:barstar family protein [Streptomyces sp. NRRL S-237]